MIEPYTVAVCQAEKIGTRSGGEDKIKENTQRNLQHYCALIDFCCGGIFAGKPAFRTTSRVKLVTFGEYAISGNVHGVDAGQKAFTKDEIIKYIALRIPGPETDVLAEKAKQYDTYIAAQSIEHDPEWPNLYFNTGFIISPKGKIILKYRKTVTNVTIAMHCSVHDIMDAYKNPISKEYDPFPVVNTSIGRLAIMICADLTAPEIPRVYSMKGAEVVLHLTSGMSSSGGGVTEARIQTRAADNAVYFVNSNRGLEMGESTIMFPRAQVAGYSKVYDYMGNLLAKADDSNEQIVHARIDIEAARQYRELYLKNPVSIIRTDLYAPYYNQPIYPANTFLRDGPIEELLSDQQIGYFNQAMENLKKCQHFYDENDV